ncbi:DUF4350 domain-containing protein [Arcanobacterium canis]|uniref:DUF4350 domain-containing protein n=1 Tax=Arcanobacterium canis TaxID=999183 RepID=A0ABY8FZK9_9ACTO|nr:DUF4350 domain-containing protein [Arcanobacterium canis]WFM83757.1 hypothetical protein P7079_01890 [Arcanobacterium canis]
MRKRHFVIIAAIILILVTAALLLSPRPANQDALAPDAVRPQGAGALGALLEDNGASISYTTSISDAVARLSRDSTLVLPWSVASAMTPAQARQVKNTQAHIVIISDETTASLKNWGYDVAPYWIDATTATSSDTHFAARTIGPLRQVIPGPGFFAADGGVAISQRSNVTLLADGSLLTNAHLATHHNAALGLDIVGSHRNIIWVSVRGVWHTPTPKADQPLTYPWLIPALIGAGGIAAFGAVVLGRRFGPLVPERLPSIVDARESRRGLALAYSLSRDPGHAAAILRAASIARVAKTVGLNRHATPETVVTTLAHHTARDPQQLTELLYTRQITTDSQLVELQRELEGAL